MGGCVRIFLIHPFNFVWDTMGETRIDKWLWAVRIFKTRSLSADACKKNRVKVNGSIAKSSRTIKTGDIISVRKPPIEYTFEVLEPIQNRVGAKIVNDYVRNITSPDQYEILEMQKISGFVDRAKGLGRPTKKDRRDLDEFANDFFDENVSPFWDDDEDFI